MKRITSVILWIVAVILAIVAFIGGWAMGDIGLKFPAFLVRWLLPLVILFGFGYYRKRIKSS